MGYLLDHSKLGFCWWDLAAFAVLLVMFILIRKNLRKLEQQKKELEDAVTAASAEKIVNERLMEAGK